MKLMVNMVRAMNDDVGDHSTMFVMVIVLVIMVIAVTVLIILMVSMVGMIYDDGTMLY